jgi:hypothetical protein
MAARGFLNAQHTTGGAPRVTEYPLASGQTIRVGDLVKLASGQITKATDEDDQIIGVAAADSVYGESEFTTSLVDDSSVDYNKCRVYDDLANTIFVAEVQVAATTAASMVGGLYALQPASQANGQSRDFIDGDLDGTGSKVAALIKGLYLTADTGLTPNWGGTAAKVYCQLIETAATSRAMAV